MPDPAFMLQLLLILSIATAMAYWYGWGIARLALPPELQPYRRAIAPLVGYAIAIVAGYWVVWTVAGLNIALPLTLVAAAILNALAWKRFGRPFAGRLPNQLTAAEGAALLGLLLATLLSGIAPLLNYGRPAAIGGGWDIESALAVVRYLERGPIAAIAAAPDNPLRDLVAEPPKIGKTLGFAIWQGFIDLALALEAFITFTPLIAWLRALGVLAVYLMLRATLGVRWGAALLGAAWVSANALLLWTAYFNFEKQLAGWPLIPLGLLIGVAAVEDIARRGAAAWPAAVLAAFILTAQAVAYYPALTIWGPLAIGLGIARLVDTRFEGRAAPSIASLSIAALALIGLTAIVAAPTIVDYFQGFAFRYDNQVTTLGVFRYIPFSDVMGLTPFFPQETVTPPAHAATWIGGGLLAALLLAALARGPQRSRWIGMLIGGAIYFAWLRWAQEYPYAYMKGASYAGFIFLGMAAAGLQGVWEWVSARRPAGRAGSVALRGALAAGALALLALMGAAHGRVVAAHWERPGLYPDDAPALLELRRLTPPGSSVTLTSDVRVQGVISGFAAYALDHTVVWGTVRTGYAGSRAGAPDAIGDYGLLHISEDPLPWGYSNPPIWRGGSYALYQRSTTTLARLRYPATLAANEALHLTLGADRLVAGKELLSGGAPRALQLLVAALTPGALEIDSVSFRVPAGRHTILLPNIATPRDLIVRNAGAAPIALEAATLLADSAAAPPRIDPVPASAVATAAAVADATSVTTNFEVLLPDAGPLTLALDIWDVRRGVQYGWYGILAAPAPERQQFSLTLDLPSGAARGIRAGGEELPLGAQFAGLSRGQYIARLHLAAGAQVLAEPVDLFGFDVTADGTIANVWARASTLRATGTIRPRVALDLRVADNARLAGYTLLTPQVRPGEPIDFVVWWQAIRPGDDERSVLVHLVDAAGNKLAQGDGPPADGIVPTGQWGAGQTIIDARRLSVPPDLPPGQYTLLIGMYRWPSLERVTLSENGARLAEDALRIPIVVGSR